MPVDWERVLGDAGQAALDHLQTQLPVLLHVVETQTLAMVANGRFIEANKDSMTAAEYEMVKRAQVRAARGAFATFEGIGTVTAQLAAEAAWDVVATALRTAAGIAFA